jgi:hypothetical protein
MGFIDKVKATVKAGAEQAATKAQSEYERMQRRRELDEAYEALGVKAFELADKGDLAHRDLAPLVEEVRTVKAKLDAVEGDAPDEGPEPPAKEPQTGADTEKIAEEEPPPFNQNPPNEG